MQQTIERISPRTVIDVRRSVFEFESTRRELWPPSCVQRDASMYEDCFGLSEGYLKKVVNEAIDHYGNARVLDIGCGAGSALSELKEVNPEKVETVGVTASRFGNYKGVDRVLVGDAQNLQRIEGVEFDYFDLVLSNYVAEYLADPLALLKGAYASLREGGRAFIGPGLGHLVVLSDLLQFWRKNGYIVKTDGDNFAFRKGPKRLKTPVKIETLRGREFNIQLVYSFKEGLQ